MCNLVELPAVALIMGLPPTATHPNISCAGGTALLRHSSPLASLKTTSKSRSPSHLGCVNKSCRHWVGCGGYVFSTMHWSSSRISALIRVWDDFHGGRNFPAWIILRWPSKIYSRSGMIVSAASRVSCFGLYVNPLPIIYPWGPASPTHPKIVNPAATGTTSCTHKSGLSE